MNYFVAHQKSHLSRLTCKNSKPRQTSRSEYRTPNIPLIRLVNHRWQDSVLLFAAKLCLALRRIMDLSYGAKKRCSRIRL